jgi:lipopolysaccharide/colanic/teichoic acid biosynthesis glycosyltransferase
MQKHEENAYYATHLEEMAVRMTGRALLALSADITGVQIISQERVGFGGALFNLLKTQTHEKPDSALGTTEPVWPVGEFVNGFAIDEYIQIRQVSKDPLAPGDMSFIGPRPQTLEEISAMRSALYASGYKREFDEWLYHYCMMRPGIFGPGSLLKYTGHKKGTLPFYLARMQLDEQYFFNASSRIDAMISFSVLHAGVRKLGMRLPKT